MARSGLNDMSRRRRLAQFLNEEDGHYFAAHTTPALEKLVEQLKEARLIPPNLTFADIWSEARSHKRYTGNIILGDERAFLCPPLNNAHQSGDIRELARQFIALVPPAARKQAHENEIALNPHIEVIGIAGATLEGLAQSSGIIKLARRLCDHFMHTYPDTIVKTLEPNFAVLRELGYQPVTGHEISIDDIMYVSANPTTVQTVLACHMPNDAADQFIAWLDAQKISAASPEARL